MYLPRGLRRVHWLDGHCDLSRSVLALVRWPVSVTRVEVVMSMNVALMTVLAVFLVVYVLRRRSRLSDDV